MSTRLYYADFYKQKKRHGTYDKIRAETELFMKLHEAESFLEANGRSATQKKSFSFFGNQRFKTVFTRVCHYNL